MKRICILLLVALLQACGGGGGGSAPSAGGGSGNGSCSVADQRATVLSWMQSNYYWYKQMPTPNAAATTMDAYFRSMLYTPTDRFSFTEPTVAFQQLFQEGTFTGYGYSLAIIGTNTLRVRTVEPQGPAYAAGLRRGDTIVSVNGYSPDEILAGEAGPVTEEGIPRTIVAIDVAGNEKDLTMVSATFPLTPVRDVTVLNATRNGQAIKVGYIDYTQFVTYSFDDLMNTMVSFAAQGVSELVLDLRYNGGGDVATSRDLASMIGGPRLVGNTFASLVYNDKNAANNYNYLFRVVPSLPNLSRVVVIASEGTASASELLINGLKPFMPVVLVGSTTYGKPYGFQPFDYCGTTYNAVNFEAVNSLGVGGYTSGFAPTCPAADDLNHQLGDPNEGELRTALGYIATGVCPQAGQSALLTTGRPNRVLGDVLPPRMIVEGK